MATTRYGFVTPTSNTKLSAFAAVVEDLALKLDSMKLFSIAIGANLNTMKSQGDFIQNNNTNATLALNYPVALAGMLEVFTHPVETMVWQRYTTYASSTTPITRVFVRGCYPTAGTWSAWTELGAPGLTWATGGVGIVARSTRVGVQQLAYADTGRRDIKTSLAAGATVGGLFVRRTNWTVEVDFQQLSAPGYTNLFTLLVGYRPDKIIDFTHWDDDNQITCAIRIDTAGVVSARTDYANVYGSMRFETTSAWPTAAAGTASGTIPS